MRHLDKLRNAVERTESQARDVAGYRATGAALAAAERRADALRQDLDRTTNPTKKLRREFADAAAESRRLAAQLGRQSRALEEARVDVGRLGAEERRLTRTLRDQRQELGRVEQAMERRNAAKSRREAARIDVVEAGALAYAAVRPIQAVIGAAVEFEEKMADVGKVVDFAAPTGLDRMGKDIRNLSKELPVSAAGIADIVAAAGQSGVAKGSEELLRFASDTAKVAVAFDLTGAAAGAAMAGVSKVFGLGQDAAMDLAGAYNHLSNNLGASAAGLLQVGEVAGSNAQLVGLSGRQLAALGSTLLDLKTPPAEAATALNSMFTKFANIEKLPKKAQQALGAVGLTASGLKQALRADAEQAMVGFFEAVSKVEKTQQVEVLSAIFGEDHAPKAAKIAASLETYAKARRLATADEANAASVLREFEVRAATTANALQQFRNRLSDLSIAVGDALLPGLNGLLGAVSPLIDGLAFLADKFPVVTTTVVGLTGGLILGRVAMVAYRYAAASAGEVVETVGLAWKRALPVRRALTGAWGRGTAAVRLHTLSLAGVPAVGNAAALGIGKASTALRTFRTVLVSTGVGALVVGLGMAAEWLMRNWEPVKSFFAGVGQGIGEALGALGPVGDALVAVGREVAEFFQYLFGPVDASTEQLEAWGAAGVNAGKWIGKAITSLVAPLFIVGNLIGAAWAAVQGDTETAKRRWEQTGDWMKRSFGGVIGQAVGVVDDPDAEAAAGRPGTPGATFAAAEPKPAPAGGGATFAATPALSGRPAASVQVTANITVQPPAGSDEQEIAREVGRQLADQMRRAAVEAGLGESDDA